MYGIQSTEGQKTYEAWLQHQSTRDLREMLRDDPEMDSDSQSFIRDLISSRRSPARGE